MKKILSVILGLALCCMLAALPVCAEETAAPVQAETAEIGDGHVTLVSDSDQLIPVYVDEEAEGAEGTVEQAMAATSALRQPIAIQVRPVGQYTEIVNARFVR